MNKQGKNGIEWCDYTWSPVTGCLHGCEYCYARRIANRFSPDADKVKAAAHYCGIGKGRLYDIKEPWAYDDKTLVYPFGFEPTFHRYRLDEPAKIKKPQKIFVCSMADLFGDWVPDEWIEEVFNVVMETDHQYLFLTKNPKRYDNAIAYYANKERGFGLKEGYWDNCWFGTTVTHQEETGRVAELLKFEGGHKFVSIEPILGAIDFLSDDYLGGCINCEVCLDNPKTCINCAQNRKIDWVIIGAQTGPGAVPPKDEWVQSIIDQCKAAGVPVFVKSPLYEKFPIQEWPEGLR